MAPEADTYSSPLTLHSSTCIHMHLHTKTHFLAFKESRESARVGHFPCLRDWLMALSMSKPVLIVSALIQLPLFPLSLFPTGLTPQMSPSMELPPMALSSLLVSTPLTKQGMMILSARAPSSLLDRVSPSAERVCARCSKCTVGSKWLWCSDSIRDYQKV